MAEVKQDIESQKESKQQIDSQNLSNKRIANNALILYFRMFLTMIVGLYTSRVVLATLGKEDFGTYGVVGGVVAMMGFLNASMSSATSRFLTFEIGRGDRKKLRDTFSSALIIHIGIAILVFVIAETLGLWFLCNKLNIPEGRMTAAHWVYQCSIVSAMLGITQAPYNASIIAHEKMGVYGYVEILNVSLKLAIVYLLVIGNFDKLILYAILHLAVSLIIMLIYRIYCIRKFNETHFHWIWNKNILKPLLSFSGWDIYNNLCLTCRAQGRNFLINIFFNVVYNAASSISTIVTGTLSGLARNILVAFRPQITKAYAQGSFDNMNSLLFRSTKISTLFAVVVSVPICFQIRFILGLWLKDVPVATAEFCVLSLISWCFIMLFSSLTIGNHATGKIKGLSILTGSLHLLNIPIVWIGFELGVRVEFAYIVSVITNFFIIIVNLYFIKKWIVSFSIIDFFSECALPIAYTTLIILVLCLGFRFIFGHNLPFFQLIVFTIISLGATYIFGLTSKEKKFVLRFIKSRFHLNEKRNY